MPVDMDKIKIQDIYVIGMRLHLALLRRHLQMSMVFTEKKDFDKAWVQAIEEVKAQVENDELGTIEDLELEIDWKYYDLDEILAHAKKPERRKDRQETQEARLEEFKELVGDHDITYAYSDSYPLKRSGEVSMRNIRELAKELPEEEVSRIWNSHCDETLEPFMAKKFYWPAPLREEENAG